jgi:hypothetical protein
MGNGMFGIARPIAEMGNCIFEMGCPMLEIEPLHVGDRLSYVRDGTIGCLT